MNDDPRQALRHDLRQRRRDLPAAERIAAAESLADALLALPFAPRGRRGRLLGAGWRDRPASLAAATARRPHLLPAGAGRRVLRFAPWRPGQR
jgi:5-formyltetrahydrofolate cyclo-ligase